MQLPVVVSPLQYADIHACARITAAAFSTDRHTIVKQLGGKPFDMYDISRDGFLATLHRKNYIYVKAVDTSGNIVGHAGWGFRGVDEAKIPSEGQRDGPESCKEKGESLDFDELSATNPESEVREGKGKNSIDSLHALEDADMQHAMTSLMPSGTSCMYFIGLIVAPEHQSQGVGSELIEFGNAIADRLGIFTWVHSSDQAWRAYARFGFEVVKELTVDLDEYAPSAPGRRWADRLVSTAEGVTVENWGRYTIRYMKRLPKAKDR
jgi:GNAT superfamily N-acetyltransferase